MTIYPFCSTLESVVVGFTLDPQHPAEDMIDCSTLESVVVGFTAALSIARRPKVSAQRSKASLSGSLHLSAFAFPWTWLLNARKRRCRVHGEDGSGWGCRRERGPAQRSKASLSGSRRRGRSWQPEYRRLLNARKRRCRVHTVNLVDPTYASGCSTLESVVVGFTRRPKDRESPLVSAQRSKASLSGSRDLPRRSRSANILLNARKRRCRVHNPSIVSKFALRVAAQRSKASLSGSPCPR